MSGSEPAEALPSHRDVEVDPLLVKNEDEATSESMLRTNRGGGAPATTRTCRICMDEESDPAANPLISPCKCAGTTKYVHRQCLLKWRTMKAGTQAHYRCEICHYRYQFRRLWWARILGHPLTSGLIFVALLVASSWLLGYVPLVESMAGVPPGSSVWLHFLDGLILVGLLGAVLMLVSLCTSGAGLPVGACDGCVCDPYCPAVAIGGGEECVALLALLAVSLAVAGLVWVCKTLYGALYSGLRARMRWAQHMVENVGGNDGEEGSGDSSKGGGGLVAAWRRRWWLRRPGGGSASGATASGSGSGSGASSSSSAAAGPSSGQAATRPPPEESMV